jgi:RNA polymerase sigma-70 factor (ECF subfamily)
MTFTETSLDESTTTHDTAQEDCAPLPIPLLSAKQVGEAYQEYYPRLIALGLRMLRNQSDAEDVVHSGFEKALRNRHQFRGDAKISTWLHRIVANEALMLLRSKRRHPTDSDELLEQSHPQLENSPTADQQLARFQERALLQRAMARLSREDFHILERCGLRDESYEAFGKSMRLHPAAVKTRAFRARRKLRDLILAELETTQGLCLEPLALTA